jgi:predicted MFS family arabinose efflux permease
MPEEKVPGAVGMVAALTAVGGGLGIVLAGPIVTALDYHWLFWIPFIALVLVTAAAQILLPESHVTKPGKINWLAAMLMSGWLVALLIAASEAPTWGWGSSKVIGLLIATVIIGVIWVLVESRSANPLIDMKMMRVRAVWTNNLVALLFGVGLYAMFAFLPEFLQTSPRYGYGFGASVTQSGLMILPQTATMFVIGLFAANLARKLGAKNLVVAGSTVATLSFVLITFQHDQEWEIYVVTALIGTGFGLAFTAMSNLIIAAVPPEQTGVASGMNANIRTIGGSLGAAFMASVVTASAGSNGVPTEAGYQHGFLMLGGALLLSAVAALLIPVTGRKVGPDILAHAELAIVAAGTLVGDDPE